MQKTIWSILTAVVLLFATDVFAWNDNPPTGGQTTVSNDCRRLGVTVDRYDAFQGHDVKVRVPNTNASRNVDVNMSVKNNAGQQSSYDTRTNWPSTASPDKKATHFDKKIQSTDDIDIQCYDRTKR